MPIYEYTCTPCGKQFEELIVRKSDEAQVVCPACRSAEVKRLISRPAATPGSGDGGGGGFGGPSCGPIG
ncbi:FmdB family zinc ribbon protein [Anaeromyxobacter oryzisoli]|uniref:FmdB family zinc ribbon protein n=1 Tax=Anaeromyxobacter oryzisoli TaxID=2925408 RepID=UPI001F57D963|nr:zinc ribbon domain-containing protein [Anaeromyxobacter sp. SG63]